MASGLDALVSEMAHFVKEDEESRSRAGDALGAFVAEIKKQGKWNK